MDGLQVSCTSLPALHATGWCSGVQGTLLVHGACCFSKQRTCLHACIPCVVGAAFIPCPNGVLCRACATEAKREQRAQYSAGAVEPTYMRRVLQGNQLATQCTSLLDVGLHVQEHAHGFQRGSIAPRSLVHQPLLAADDVVAGLSTVLPTLPLHMHANAAGETAAPAHRAPPCPPGCDAASDAAMAGSAEDDSGSEYEDALSDSGDLDDAGRVLQVHCTNMLRNPLVQHYVTVGERRDAHVPASALSRSLCDANDAAARARGPLARQQHAAAAAGIGILVDERQAPHQRHARFVQDGLVPRTSPAAPDADEPCWYDAQDGSSDPWVGVTGAAACGAHDACDSDDDACSIDSDCSAAAGWGAYSSGADSGSGSDDDSDSASDISDDAGEPLRTRPDGTPVAGGGKMGVSVEAGLFPMIFTHARGWYRWARRSCLNHYLRMRMLTVFSLFTLYLPYLLYMFAVRQQHLLAAAMVDQVLQRDVARQRRRHPHATDSELVQDLLRNRVPATLTNSPAYFRSNLADLQCMVAKLGMPRLFLTLTEDEISTSRWDEIADLEQCMDRWVPAVPTPCVPPWCSAPARVRVLRSCNCAPARLLLALR